MNTELRKIAKNDFEKDYLERQWKMLVDTEILN